MYSHRSEYGDRKPYSGERSSRQRDKDDERRQPHRDSLRDSHPKYGGAERTSGSREYGESPTRQYGKDSYSRDWSRRSPAKRSTPPRAWDASEKSRGRYTGSQDVDYRFMCETQEKMYRQSADGFSSGHAAPNFKDAPPQEKDFKYREATREPRYPYRAEELRRDDASYRPWPASHRDRSSRDRSWERSPDRTTKNPTVRRKRAGTPGVTAYDEDYQNSGAKFCTNGSTEEMAGSRQPYASEAPPGQQKSTKGFQRFLDVLNKGVNVDELTKIVGETSAEAPPDRPRSPNPPTNAADPPNPRPSGDQQPSSESPPEVETPPLDPEDLHRRKQIQNVLHAIGMDLGFDELGKMSSRIQERLYGRKEDEHGRKAAAAAAVARESGARPPYSPKRRSKSSSSSRSSFTPRPRESYAKRDSYGDQTDASEAAKESQSAEFNSFPKDAEEPEANSQDGAVAASPQSYPAYPAYPAYAVSAPPPVMPAYSPAAYSPATYSPATYSPAPYPQPPVLPHTAPGPFYPPPQPYFHYPAMPPVYPPMPPQVMPQQHSSNLTPLKAAQKSKPAATRKRFLQVIQTNPG